MKILLIEDDSDTASFIIKGLKQEGFSTECAYDGEEGWYFLNNEIYDVVIIDIMLPKLNGFELISKVRKHGLKIPIIILSAKDSVSDRVKGLEIGADDYLTKPFAFSELVARIHALIRRSNQLEEPNFLQVGDLKLDILKKKVYRQGIEITLQPREFALLEYLMRNAGRVVSKTMIMEHVWDYNFDPQTNVVEARICRLRDKIDRPFRKNLIHTIRGLGYVLEERD